MGPVLALWTAGLVLLAAVAVSLVVVCIRWGRHWIRVAESGGEGGLRDEPAGSPEEACLVCRENEMRVALIPCGHAVLCIACSRQLAASDRPCPICRVAIDSGEAIWYAGADDSEMDMVQKRAVFAQSLDLAADQLAEHDEHACVVCLERASSVQFRPCMHTVCCNRCARDIQLSGNGKCPLCRETFG